MIPIAALPDTPTPYRIDKTSLEVRANLVPATGGQTQRFAFTVGASSDPDAPALRAVVRRGADGVPLYRVTLPGTEEMGLAYLHSEAPWPAACRNPPLSWPEVVGDWQPIFTDEWEWRNSLLGVDSSTAFDAHFTLDDLRVPGTVVSYPIPGGEYVHEDYRASVGYTIRFGDGEFGMIPPDGAIFVADYRLNRGENLPR